jgi:hypothetical protein
MSEKMNIHEKLASMQSVLLATKINKSGQNKHNGAKYYELEDLLPPVKIVCKQHNVLTYFNFPYDLTMMGYRAELHLINLDDLNDKLIFEVPYPALEKINNGMNIMQSEGAYLTYLRRYLLLDTFDLLENEIIDASDWDNNDDTRTKGVVIDERPSSLQKVIDRCKKDYSEEECDVKLLNKVSLKMFKEKILTKQERTEIFEYLKEKQ